eukprot:CAMPEP_0206063446 /NCGR_PEP_ID=MMETSP1466-20131121/58232_1 /ASSEMBLY_ACC=CAM_ASM_001126 /TAXON_ID=44452 /ORGANISM="Pavlova gyrans, Strain CCMP608" /LENGTH=457 /DNA_ID=CAMNT_0053438815 /DNA_START=71 /DNA_END=1441 /DNA_ORIENTATION=-
MPLSGHHAGQLLALAALAAGASALQVSRVYPTRGSTMGGTYIVIEGSGFMMPMEANPWDAQVVFVGAQACDISAHFTGPSRIVCVTRPAAQAFATTGRLPVTVQRYSGIGEVETDTLLNAFTFDAGNTPSVWWAAHWAAAGGDTLSFHGSLLGALESANQLEVRIGDVRCETDEDEMPLQKWSSGVRTVDCRLPEDALVLPGRFNLTMRVKPFNPDSGLCSNPPCFHAQAPASSTSNGYGSGGVVVPTPTGVSPRAREFWAGTLDLATGEAYSFELVPRVDSVEPTAGGLFGGQRLTVHGASFSEEPAANSVTVGGVPCEVVESTTAAVVCILGAASDAAEPTPTPRGLLYRDFATRDVDLAADWASRAAPAVRTGTVFARPDFIRDASARSLDAEDTGSSGLTREVVAYIVPPLTADYTFYVTGDDEGALEVGASDDWGSLVREAHFASYAQVASP